MVSRSRAPSGTLTNRCRGSCGWSTRTSAKVGACYLNTSAVFVTQRLKVLFSYQMWRNDMEMQNIGDSTSVAPGRSSCFTTTRFWGEIFCFLWSLRVLPHVWVGSCRFF